MKKTIAVIAALAAAAALLLPVYAAEQETPEEEALRASYHAAALAGLYEADLTAMSQSIEAGLLSCEDLTAYYLERIDAYNDTYNCFITICDNALEIARQRDAQLAAGNAEGALFGIPVVIKDNMDYEGFHTTSGHKKKDSQIASQNAEVVQYLLDHGAVIIGKTNMSTDAQDARASFSFAVGETLNAYSTNLTSGGSSGGSATAVSLNFAAAGLGTDTNSSLRYPAALNGCVSLRPTWDFLSTEGIDALNSTRDVPGVITRTVYDQALMLDVISGGTTHYTENLDADALTGLRIGVLEQTYVPNSRRSASQIDTSIIKVFESAVAQLEACGAQIVPMRINALFTLSDGTLNNNKASSKQKLYDAFTAALEENNVSAVVFPTYISAPLKTGTDETGKTWNFNTQHFVTNCKLLGPSCGVPEISIPIGNHSSGAGIGMEICAAKNQEQLLLNIAYGYTLRYDHRQIPADTPDLHAADRAGTLQEVLALYQADLEALSTETVTDPVTEPMTESPTEVPTDAPETQEQPEANGTDWINPAIAAVIVIVVFIVPGFEYFRREKRKRDRRRQRKRKLSYSEFR